MLTNKRQKSSSIFRTIPLVTTQPDIDLGIVVGLLPVWWLLGLEQFIWPVLFLGISLKIIILRKGKVVFPNVLVIFSLFLIFQIITAITVLSSEPFQSWFVFFRNFAAFFTGYLAFFIILNALNNWFQVKRLVITIVLVMGLTAFIGLLAVVGLLQFRFNSPISSILPSWLAASDAADRFVLRTLGRNAVFLSIRYYRLSTFFSFPTLYASAILPTLPLAVFSVQMVKKRFIKILLWIAVALLLINLISTTSRAATLSLVIGFIYLQGIVKKRRRVVKWGAIIMIAFIILIFVLINQTYYDFVNDFFTTRSTGERFSLYMTTLNYWLQKPLLGWGISRNIEATGLSLPLGSHSFYLSTLFRFGVFGFLLLFFLYWLLWHETRPFSGQDDDDDSLRQMNVLLQYGRWVLVSVFMDSVATIPVTDMSTIVFVWISFSVLFITRKLAIRMYAVQQESSS